MIQSKEKKRVTPSFLPLGGDEIHEKRKRKGSIQVFLDSFFYRKDDLADGWGKGKKREKNHSLQAGEKEETPPGALRGVVLHHAFKRKGETEVVSPTPGKR